KRAAFPARNCQKFPGSRLPAKRTPVIFKRAAFLARNCQKFPGSRLPAKRTPVILKRPAFPATHCPVFQGRRLPEKRTPVIFKRAAFPRASDDSIRPSQQPLRQQRWDRRQHALQRPRRAVLQRRFSVDLATFAFVKNCYCADSLFSEAGAGDRPESL